MLGGVTYLELPLESLLDEAQELLKSGIPGLEDGTELVEIGILLCNTLGEVVGTDEDNVVDLAALEEVAHGVRAGAHPVVDHGDLYELSKLGVLAHVAGLDQDSVGKIAGVVWGILVTEVDLTALGLESVGSNDEVGLEGLAGSDGDAGSIEIDLVDVGVENNYSRISHQRYYYTSGNPGEAHS